MYVFKKSIYPFPPSFILDYARTEKERETFLNEYDGWNYPMNFPMTKGYNYNEQKIPKYRLRNIIHAANIFCRNDRQNIRIVPPKTPRQRRQESRIPCPF